MKPIHYLLIVAVLLAIVKITTNVATDHADGENQNRVLQIMTPERMRAIIQTVDPEAEADGNTTSFAYQGVDLTLVFDPRANRMRLVSPIAPLAAIPPEMMDRAMEANFHTALDARYATTHGQMWSVFIHPLASLDDALFRSAIHQVAVAKLTFGDTYSSGALQFGEPTAGEEVPIPDNRI